MKESDNAIAALDALLHGLKEAGTDGWYYDEYQLIKEFIESHRDS